MRLQRFFLNHLRFGLLSYLLLSCSPSQKEGIDLSYLGEADRQKLITRVQEEVNNKVPFQGSLTHQLKCDTLIALNHNITGALQEKSTPYTKIGDYHIAFPLLEQAAKVDPKDALYYYSWLLLYYYRDYPRAIERLNEYDNFTPNEPDFAWGENVNYLKGIAHKQMEEYNVAIDEFSKAIKDDGTNVELYAFVYRGIAYLKDNNPELAIKDFNKAIKEYDKCSTAYYWKGVALLMKKKRTEALVNFQISLELLKKGYFKSDPYMEIFDVPSEEQVEDKIKEISSKNPLMASD